MKIIRIAQSDSDIKQLKKCLEIVFQRLEGVFGIKATWDRTYFLTVAIEKHDESMMENWTQVSHSRDSVNFSETRSTIVVDRYYESERAQDEYGKTEKVIFDWTQPEETFNQVMMALRKVDRQLPL